MCALIHRDPQISDRRMATVAKMFLLLLCNLIAFSPLVRAVSPPPDGGYPNRNTVEGDQTLLNLTTGGANTAIGFNALSSTTTGSANTAGTLSKLS
jgi:hypothetical protein